MWLVGFTTRSFQPGAPVYEPCMELASSYNATVGFEPSIGSNTWYPEPSTGSLDGDTVTVSRTVDACMVSAWQSANNSRCRFLFSFVRESEVGVE